MALGGEVISSKRNRENLVEEINLGKSPACRASDVESSSILSFYFLELYLPVEGIDQCLDLGTLAFWSFYQSRATPEPECPSSGCPRGSWGEAGFCKMGIIVVPASSELL